MKFRKIIILLICLLPGTNLFCAQEKKVTIVAFEVKISDKGYQLACDFITKAFQSRDVRASVVWLAPDVPLPTGDLILVGNRKEMS